MARPGKDVSMGEYDPVTGLTHITHQRGRLLFNMGASVKKQQRRDVPAPNAPTVTAKPTPPPTSTGTFTGLSLYPEEANYLLQRGALLIHLVCSNGENAKELSVADFTAMAVKDTRVSSACMEVYNFLKDQKLHPRRCIEPITAPTTTEDGRSIPRHFKAGEPCDVAFDVWKAVAVDVAVSKDAEALGSTAAKPKKQKQKHKKTLALVFRVVVCRYGDAAPDPRSLRQAIENSTARDLNGGEGSVGCVPVKVAVVHQDQSVLLFEISSNPSK